jgi:isopentenyl diphosphate isomerase/L-lactate dehydrogenase-like FMN-dependent dehydrogenase
MEQVAEELGSEHPRWYQLYWVNNREVTASFVKRAEAAGYRAIVVTLDTLRLAWRDRDLRHGYLPFLKGEGIGQYTSDPVFRALYPDQADVPDQAGPLSLMLFTNLGLKWADFEWLRQQTSLPLLVKGVLTAEDAEQARRIGLDGVVVSNHGGRQVDGAVAALDALVEVREAVGADYPLLFDGGIRRGADVMKAMALGADAVLLGRPYIYGLAIGGQAGVERVIKQMWAEVDTNLSLLGAHSVRELDRSWVAEAPR